MSTSSNYFVLLTIVNYATPVAVSIVYVVTTAIAWCALQKGHDSRLSNFGKRALSCLGVSIVVSYIAEAWRLALHLETAPDDALVHAISQTLLWITFCLVLVNTKNPMPFIWISVVLLNLILEGTICALTYIIARKPGYQHYYSLGGIQTLICVLLAVYTALSFVLLQPGSPRQRSAESQSLIAKKRKRATDTASAPDGYDTLRQPGNEESSEGYLSDSDSGSDSIDSDEDDGDEEIRDLQKQRLEESGNWFSYIAEFKVFLPYLIPKDNFRIQLYLIFLIINTLAERALLVLEPRQLGLVIDALTVHRAIPWKEILLWIMLRILASNSCGVGALNELLENRISAWSRQQLSIAAFDQVMSLSMSFHDEKDSGEVIKAIEQADSMNSLLRAVIIDIGPGIMDIFVATVYITYLFDLYAMLIVVAWGVAVVFATQFMTIIMTAARRMTTVREREESKLVYESVSNWFTVSYFNRKRHTMSRLARAAGDTATAQVWSDDMYTYMFAVQESTEMITLLGITILAARRIVNGLSTVGDFVTLQAYWMSLTMPLYSLSHSYRQLNQNLVDAERLLQLFKQNPVINDSAMAQPLQLESGRVEFENVDFAYPGRQMTLKKLNFSAHAGQMTAFVGETGSGKSTTFKLLMRFHDVTNGAIKIDGQDLRDITLDSLRECFGFVPQDTVLFNMSILENVRYARLDATDEEIYAACRAAAIHEKILSFPKGYASKVGERGVKLSGGERQRVAIARVFLKNASIVLLDEATSAMDSETEAKIQGALKTLVQGRTTFVIAHRLSTIVEADQILVIDQGQVVESGTHQELLQQNGRYMELWRKQAAVMPVMSA